jgi:oligopeptidase B
MTSKRLMIFGKKGQLCWGRNVGRFPPLGRLFSSNDPFQFYKRPSRELWQHMANENARTLGCIHKTLKVEIERDLLSYKQITIPELGPTGQFFYSTSMGSDNHLRYSRSEDNDGSFSSEILSIDMNVFELKATSLSVDEKYLAYVLLAATTQESQLWIKNISNNEECRIGKEITHVSSVEWGPIQKNGAQSLFFSTTDHWHRPDRVFACSIMDHQISEPSQVYYNSDESVIVDIQRTKGCNFIALTASSKSSNEIFLLREISSPLLLVRLKQAGVMYHIDVGPNGDVYLLASSNDENHESGLDRELKLFLTCIDDLPLKSSFGEFLAGRSNEFVISDMDIFHGFIVLYERSILDGTQRIRVISDSTERNVTLSQLMNPCGNMYFYAKKVLFTLESPIQTPIFYEYDFEKQTISSLSNTESEKDVMALKVSITRMLAISSDGTKVPLVLFHRQDVDPYDRKSKVVLVGYGAYGEPVMRGFDITAAVLAKRGIVIAYALTRGGGDLGRSWYEHGRLYNKRNAVNDYLACARHLVDSIVDPSMLTAKATSAGGVIVGASLNSAPELFGSAVFVNAFLDVKSSMSLKMALTEHEYDEWGDPTKDQIAAQVIHDICPMTNLNPKDQSRYPHTLIVGTLDDTRVPYWHAVSFHAKLGGEHLLYIVPQGGHQLHGFALDVNSLISSFILRPPI